MRDLGEYVRFPNDGRVHIRGENDDETECGREIPGEAVDAHHFDSQLLTECSDCFSSGGGQRA